MKRTTLALLTVAALALTGCATGGGDSAGGDNADGNTITHAFGETTVPEGVERIVTIGWGSTEAVLSLGLVPVGIEEQVYGGNEDRVVPWVAEEIERMGAEMPTVFPTSAEEPAYEEILELEPEVILAPYSGLTQEQYEVLSDIAPTVAYPEEAWTTPWRDVVRIVGDSLGLGEEAEEVIADAETAVAEQAAAHPELEGRTVAAIWDGAGVFYVYRAADPRVEFLFDLGLENAPAVDELANGESTFYYTLSYEQLDLLEADIVVNYATTQEEADAFLAQPYAQSIPAVARGSVATIVGESLISSVSPPSPLSLAWGVEDYVTLLAEAASNLE